MPLGLRVTLATSTTIGLRAAAWYAPDDLLSPMANYRAAAVAAPH